MPMNLTRAVAATAIVTAIGCGGASTAREPVTQSGPSAGAPGGAIEPRPTAADSKTQLVWVSLPAGKFTAGCEPQDDCPPQAGPAHPASVEAFDLMQTEVSVEAYALCVAAGVCAAPETSFKECNWGKEDRRKHPVNCVDHSQATTFCGWSGGRLPTPDEWEYAARSGQRSRYPWGDTEPDETRAHFSKASTAEVATHPAGSTPWGLHDMAGNVNEWTSGERSPGVMEMRGGSFGFPEPRRLRTVNRGGGPPTLKAGNVGFRCARNAQR